MGGNMVIVVKHKERSWLQERYGGDPGNGHADTVVAMDVKRFTAGMAVFARQSGGRTMPVAFSLFA